MDDSRQCRARSKRSGERCRRAAIRGGAVCSFHGGRAPAVVARADQRLAVAEATEVVNAAASVRRSMTMSQVYTELLRTAATAVLWRDALEEKVEALNGQWRYTSDLMTEQLRSEVKLFERAMGQAAKVLELVARLDIESRASRLDEAQGALVAAAVRRILDALDLTPEQQALVPVVVPRELRRVGGDQ